MKLIPKVNYPAMLPAMAAAILERSCDQRRDEGRSPDQMTNEHFNSKMKKANPSVKVEVNKRPEYTN